MLEAMRNAAKGWVAKILLGILVLSFAIWGITDVFKGFAAQDLASVGDVKISSERFRQDLNRELQRISQQTGTAMSLEDARKLGLDQQLLDRTINTAVIDAKADDLGLSISDKSIVDEIAQNPNFQSGGAFDANRFRQLLQSNSMDEASFLASQRNDKLRGMMTGLATDGVTLPRTLTEALLRYRNETRDARYFSITVSEADVPAPSADDLKKQYEATPAAYTAPEYRSIAVIKVEPADVASKLAVTDEELQAGYERYQADYFTPETRTVLQLSFPDVAKAEEAKKKLDAGTDFLTLAGELGFKEGDITFADRKKEDFLDSKIGEAAFALAEGAVSAPVKGDLNTVLLKAAKVSPEHQQTLEEVRDALTKRLQLDKAHDEIQSIYDAVEDARAQQTKFEDIAAKAGIPITLVPVVSAQGLAKDGSAVSLPAKEQVLKAAFESDVGVENDALTPFDGYLWYEVREVIPSALRPLEEVKDEVTKDFVAGKLRTLASDKAKAIVEKAGTTTKLDTLAQENGATIQTVSAIKRNDVSEAFDGVAALALFSAPANSVTWALDGDGKTAKIIEVSKVNTPAFQAASAETKSLADEMKQGLGADATASFIKALRGETDVSVNNELWQNIRGASAP